MRALLFLLAPAVLFAGSAPVEGWKALSGAAALDRSVSHDSQPSIRVEPGGPQSDARVEFPTVTLKPGAHYTLSAWVRTANLTVADRGRTPIALGAALAMSTMPFDMRSPSLAGTRDWTELKLPFTATATHDAIVLTVASGGSFQGSAWFSGVRLDETPGAVLGPVKGGLVTYGPAYRYTDGGWIYLHIEGAPYERGYQHGRLLVHEIETYLDRCASELDPKSRKQAWQWGRTTSNALFLRGFDQEILEEMKGIADGAADAGGKYNERKIDLIDIVTANTITELGELQSAMPMTPTGLESLHLEKPEYTPPARQPVTTHCSAFCATGKATRDGRMVIAHITMWPLTLAEQTNIMLDIVPRTGHRVLIQSYPGGIQSGTDWYQNDAGVVITETTIRQSPFNVNGLPVAFRARKAIQYGDNIDKVVEYLGTKNNGLYTNEWLIADAKTDEIAMYELGTYKTRLYRSSNNDWFGGTEGFYWGDNNAKDLNVRLEYQPDPQGVPDHVPYSPGERDITWQNLYEKFHGQIDGGFAFQSFRTAPLVTASAMDAKVATAEMARNQMVWAAFGKPNQREWVPSPGEKEAFSGNNGLYAGGYRLFSAVPDKRLQSLVAEVERERAAAKPEAKPEKKEPATLEDTVWKGWVLPATPDDTWLTAGSAVYAQALTGKQFEDTIALYRTNYRAAALSGSNELERFRQTAYKGALALHALRREMGDDAFFAFMKKFFAEHTTQTVTTAMFRDAAGAPGAKLIAAWLSASGLPGDVTGPLYAASEIHPMASRLKTALIVYGTMREAGANRYAAEQLQKRLLDWYEDAVPVKKDFEVSDTDLKASDVIFLGRPETNSALAAWAAKLGLRYDANVFEIAGKSHGLDTESLQWAAANPFDAKHMVLVMAGNSPLQTVRLVQEPPVRGQYAVFNEGKQTELGFVR